VWKKAIPDWTHHRCRYPALFEASREGRTSIWVCGIHAKSYRHQGYTTVELANVPSQPLTEEASP